MALRNLFFKKANSTPKPTAEIEPAASKAKGNIIVVADQLLEESNADLALHRSVRLPIAAISALGTVGTALMPSLRTITQTISTSSNGLYRLANAGVGDALEAAKDGSFWGVIKTADGTSKMAKFVEIKEFSSTTQTVMPINPAMLMMAATLVSIEKRLDDILDMETQILTFLEQEKESQVEGDLKMLTSILKEYKYHWQNASYTASHYKLAIDIRRTAEGNIIFYQKQIAEILKDSPMVYRNHFTDEVQQKLRKRFQYYRMSLYLYSMASFVEVMLMGNFNEEYIQQVSNRIEEYLTRYRSLFSSSSFALEEVAEGSAELQLRKGLSSAAKAVSSFVGSIPIVKEGNVDEWLEVQAERLEKGHQDSVQRVVQSFAAQSDPCCGMFVENLQLIGQIGSYTKNIYFDRDSIYLAE